MAVETLSARERELLNLVAAGKPDAEVAGELGVDEPTFRAELAAAVAKLHARATGACDDCGCGVEPAA